MTTDLTQAEIAVREKVCREATAESPVFYADEDVIVFTRDEVKALLSGILKTGRELAILRAERDGGPLFTLTAPKIDA